MKERVPLKIALVGTSSAGKTAVLETLQKQHKNNPAISFVADGARVFFEENPNLTDRFSAETQDKIQSRALENERQAHLMNPKIIVCDRSVIDAVVYVKSTGDRIGAKTLFERILYWLPTYKKFLLLDPAEVPFSKDSIRKEDIETREKFHRAFLDFFQETRIPYELLQGTLEQRVARVNTIIQKAL